MSPGTIAAQTFHDADRRYLKWLRTAPLQELRAMVATQTRTGCFPWESVALDREIERRMRCEG